jgi:hypothetical protein
VRLAVVLVLLALLGSGLAACGGDDYCGAVKEHQTELTDVTSAGGPAALLRALPIFQDLSRQAPDDIRDDWKVLLTPLEELDDALHDAGVDASSYDGKHVPASVTAPERARIEDAATALADPAVARAFDSVQQQAKDVCHTPLSL